MKKVLISDKLSDLGIGILEKQEGIEVDYKPGLSKEELTSIIGDYQGLIVRSATKVREDVLQAAKNLKYIIRAGIGVDNIDLQASSKLGIQVMNTPAGNANSTAELAIGMMFAIARNIPFATQSMKEGRWEKKMLKGVELADKTLGIIGLGRIGRLVGQKCLALGMKVIGFDPYADPELVAEAGIKSVELDTLLYQSDFITLHAVITETSRGMLNKDAFDKMKNGVYIVNCARGELIIPQDLLAALESGKVAGAALDVFITEPPADEWEKKLVAHPNVICSPHIGAQAKEAQDKVAEEAAHNMIAALLHGEVINPVNQPA